MNEKLYPLSAQEWEVCRLLADGLTNKEIGARMTLEPSTIRTHVESIYRKLKVKNRVQAARWFWRGRVSTLA